MSSKIGPHKLPTDFRLIVHKFEYFGIVILGDEKNSLHRKLFHRKNHYYKVDIKHEELVYCGYAKIRNVSLLHSSEFIIQFSFEP